MSAKSNFSRLVKWFDDAIKEQNAVQVSTKRSLDVIRDSLKIIETGKNWETKKSRIEVVIKTARQLINTCPVKDTVKQMREKLPEYEEKQIEIHEAALKAAVNGHVSKAASCKTFKAKMNAFAKASEAITDAEENDSFVSDEIFSKMKRMVAMGIERAEKLKAENQLS